MHTNQARLGVTVGDGDDVWHSSAIAYVNQPQEKLLLSTAHQGAVRAAL